MAASSNANGPSGTAQPPHSPLGSAARPDAVGAIDTVVAIVGSGFGGLSTAIRLQRAGIHDFLILERENRVGGTWRDATFPGAACDVRAVLYSLATDPYPEWERSFAEGKQIYEYTVMCFDRYRLHDRVILGADVIAASFDEAAGTWLLEIADGRRVRARAMVLGCGPLSTPAWPNIPDRNAFRGDMFHASRWNHACSIDDKRVGVIGTGATAIQFVPKIVDSVKSLTLFQRTPPWIVPKPDRKIGKFERAVYRRWPFIQKLVRLLVHLQDEFNGAPFTAFPRLARLGRFLARRHMERAIRDPELRVKLTPNYTFGCKRVLLSNDFYPALLHERTRLETASIDRFVADGIITADGQHHAFDAIICATGYDVHSAPAPFAIAGRRGQKLSDTWREFPQAYKGTTISGFPNLFMLAGPNTRIGHTSQLYVIESQVRYAASAISTMIREGVAGYDVRRDVQDRYNAQIQKRLVGTVWESGCTSFYRTPDGKNPTIWPGSTLEFNRLTRRFDAAAYDKLNASSISRVDSDVPRSAAAKTPSISDMTASEPFAAGSRHDHRV